MFKPKLSKYIDKEKEVIILRGNLNSSFTVPLIDLNSANYLTKRRNRITYFIVESFQNLIKHGISGSELSEDNTIFAISRSEGLTRLCSVNLIDGVSSVALNERFDNLKDLSKADLNKMYQNQLENAIISNSGGAGLGLIDMARKSKGNIEHQMLAENASYKKFVFETSLGASSKLMRDMKCQDYLDFMTLNDLFFYRKGNNTADNFKHISAMLLQELRLNSSKKLNKLLEFAVFELIDNVNKHAIIDEENPQSVYLKRFDNGHFGFYTKNVIFKNQIEVFRVILDSLNEMTFEQANESYIERVIANISNPSEGDVPMGLLRIRKMLETNISYEFENIDDRLSYVTLGVKV